MASPLTLLQKKRRDALRGIDSAVRLPDPVQEGTPSSGRLHLAARHSREWSGGVLRIWYLSSASAWDWLRNARYRFCSARYQAARYPSWWRQFRPRSESSSPTKRGARSSLL